MGTQHLHANHFLVPPRSVSPLHSVSSFASLQFFSNTSTKTNKDRRDSLFGLGRLQGLSPVDGGVAKARRRRGFGVVASSSSSGNAAAASFWDHWVPAKGSQSPSLSDVIWPSAGAFAAMAILGKIDQILAPKGVFMTVAPLGAVCAVLFATPSTPGARKYNMFVAQIGCAAIGVLAFTIFGPGWLARSTALSAAIAFMICTRAVHPPAASLPLLFIDGAKLHHLNFWYALFPGAAGCIILCLIQEMVIYLKENLRF